MLWRVSSRRAVAHLIFVSKIILESPASFLASNATGSERKGRKGRNYGVTHQHFGERLIVNIGQFRAVGFGNDELEGGEMERLVPGSISRRSRTRVQSQGTTDPPGDGWSRRARTGRTAWPRLRGWMSRKARTRELSKSFMHGSSPSVYG
jgi:hypothetical protein